MLFDAVNPEKHSMAHSFSTSQLKHRIIMMTKTKSSRKSYFKYAYLLPLLLVLFQYCVKSPSVDILTTDESYISADTITVFDPETKLEDILIVQNRIYKKAKQMPHFNQCGTNISSDECIFKYLAENVKYPEMARAAGTEGTVLSKIFIDPTGQVKLPHILRSVSEECDLEVIRVLRSMPKWTPGMSNGKAVTVEYIIPVKFKMSN